MRTKTASKTHLRSKTDVVIRRRIERLKDMQRHLDQVITRTVRPRDDNDWFAALNDLTLARESAQRENLPSIAAQLVKLVDVLTDFYKKNGTAGLADPSLLTNTVWPQFARINQRFGQIERSLMTSAANVANQTNPQARQAKSAHYLLQQAAAECIALKRGDDNPDALERIKLYINKANTILSRSSLNRNILAKVRGLSAYVSHLSAVTITRIKASDTLEFIRSVMTALQPYI